MKRTMDREVKRRRAGEEEEEEAEEEKGEGRSTPDSQPPRRPEGRQVVGGCGSTTPGCESKQIWSRVEEQRSRSNKLSTIGGHSQGRERA